MNIYFVNQGDGVASQPGACPKLQGNDVCIHMTSELQRLLAEVYIPFCYTSPLLCTKDIAQVINQLDPQRVLVMAPHLAERKMETAHSLFITNGISGEEAETIQAFSARVFSFIDYLRTKTDCDNVLVVAHEGVSKAFHAYFEGITRDNPFHLTEPQNGKIVKYMV